MNIENGFEEGTINISMEYKIYRVDSLGRILILNKFDTTLTVLINFN